MPENLKVFKFNKLPASRENWTPLRLIRNELLFLIRSLHIARKSHRYQRLSMTFYVKQLLSCFSPIYLKVVAYQVRSADMFELKYEMKR